MTAPWWELDCAVKVLADAHERCEAVRALNPRAARSLSVALTHIDTAALWIDRATRETKAVAQESSR